MNSAVMAAVLRILYPCILVSNLDQCGFGWYVSFITAEAHKLTHLSSTHSG